MEPTLTPETDATPQSIYPGVKALLNETWTVYSQHIWKLVGVSIFPVILYLLILTIGGIFGGATFVATNLFKNLPSGMIFLVPLILVIALAVIYIGVWAQTSLIYAVVHLEENLSVQQIYTQARAYVKRYLLTSVIIGLLAFSGLMLLVIPGIIISLLTTFSLYIVMAEQKSGLDACLISRHYVKNHKWEFFKRLLAWGLIQMLISFIFGLAVPGKKAPDDALKFILQSLDSILSGLLSLFSSVYLYSNYKHLKSMAGTNFNPNEARTKYVILIILGIIFLIGGIVGFGILTPAFLKEISPSSFGN